MVKVRVRVPVRVEGAGEVGEPEVKSEDVNQPAQP